MDELFNDLGHNRRVNMSVRGGVPNATYYVSLSYYNERGLTRTAQMENYDANMRYDRYNYTANLNLKPTETTTIDLASAATSHKETTRSSPPPAFSRQLWTSTRSISQVDARRFCPRHIVQR